MCVCQFVCSLFCVCVFLGSCSPDRCSAEHYNPAGPSTGGSGDGMDAFTGRRSESRGDVYDNCLPGALQLLPVSPSVPTARKASSLAAPAAGASMVFVCLVTCQLPIAHALARVCICVRVFLAPLDVFQMPHLAECSCSWIAHSGRGDLSCARW